MVLFTGLNSDFETKASWIYTSKMKRRNIDCLKIRRPVKRSKLTEGLYGKYLGTVLTNEILASRVVTVQESQHQCLNNFIYIKFMIFWALVLMADFLLEFRFEFLWPIWLLVRSVYDSFKYQGFAFSVFFVFIALTSDMVCFLFIPVHWLFFAASTYVWVQYVWHTERGVCLPTILLWFLFVYIEASVRLKDLRHLPSHMDLCRPFAAHCIGYPVVTLGFGFKSYMSYRIRLRKQKDVAKENEFYMKLLVEALPEEQQELYEKQKKMLHEQQAIAATTEKAKVSSKTDESVSSSVQLNVPSSTNNTHLSTQQTHSSNSTVLSSRQTVSSKRIPDKGEPLSNPSPGKPSQSTSDEKPSTTPKESSNEVKKTPKTSLSSSSSHGGESEYLERKRNLNDLDTFDSETDVRSLKTFLSTSSLVTTPSSSKSGAKISNGTVSLGNGSIPNGTGINCTQLKQDRKAKNKEVGSSHSPPPHKDEYCQRLETDVRRLKTEIHQSRQLENELRNHILTLGTSERSARAELAQLQYDNEGLQSKLVGALSTRQSDKNNLTALEKKLAEERKARATLENQLAQERRGKRGDDNSLTRATPTLPTKECTNDACKIRRTQLEAEIKQLRSDLKSMEDRLRSAENEALMFRQRSAPPSPPAVPLGLAGSEAEFLKNSLSLMKDRNSHLENSLSAETRIKLDLFSALGDARRQLEIRETMLAIRDREILDLKSRVAEVLAVMPGMDLNLNISIGSPLDLDMDHTTFSKLLSGSSMSGLLSPSLEDPPTSSASFLDPNAASYTPKLTNGDAFDA